ncbi:MAG: hypothetical protein EBX50_18240 [Chitinophagia bacterium]|nr:hypothetical protein [Chitinophagia bacterium]
MNKNDAYLLGWIIGNSIIYYDKIFFYIKNCNKDIVSKLYKIFTTTCNIDDSLLYYNMTKNMDFFLKVSSSGYIKYITRLLNLYKKDPIRRSFLKDQINFPTIPDDLLYIFVRGLFDSSGFIFRKNNKIYCGIRIPCKDFLIKLLNNLCINTNIMYNNKYNNYYFTIENMDALDFMHMIYNTSHENNDLDSHIICSDLILNRKYELYQTLKNIYPENNSKMSLYFKYYKTDKNAVSPFKSYYSNSGYNLTLIKKIKTIYPESTSSSTIPELFFPFKIHPDSCIRQGVQACIKHDPVLSRSERSRVHDLGLSNCVIEFYDTCIQIEPMYGYYFDLLSKDLLMSTGYMLAYNTHIIDASYRGNIIVALIKVDKSKPDLELPCNFIQIIPRPIRYLTPIQVKEPLNLSLLRKM